MAALPLMGTVVAVQANFYRVRLAEEMPLGELLCTRRARLKKIGQQPMVGDQVTLEEPDWAGGRGAIAAIAPRRTQLDRPPVANATQILLVFSLAEPELDPHQLSRFLVKAETTGMAVTLVLSKRDLVPEAVAADWGDRLTAWGYPPQFLSTPQQDPWLCLGPYLQGAMTVVSGPSGVGKSTLINALIPTAQLRTGAVSGKLGRGRHTTRHVELFALPQGGLLADTPGFNQPDIHCTPEELGQYFPEIRTRQRQTPCQFANCLHQGEPGCGVGQEWDRYGDYCDLLQDCLGQREAGAKGEEWAMKQKMGQGGQVYEEPRLLAKKYRRTSRRRSHQTLQGLDYEGANSGDGLGEEDWAE